MKESEKRSSAGCIAIYILFLFAGSGFTQPDVNFNNGSTAFSDSEAMQYSTEWQELLHRVRRTGSVSITVRYKLDGYSSEMAPYFVVEISKLHARFMEKIWDYHVHSVRKMQRSPEISLTVDEGALLRIFEMDMVEEITPKRMFRTF